MSFEELQQRISKKFTKEVLMDILKAQSHLKEIEIQEIRLGESPKKGENFLSTMCRFSVLVRGTDLSDQEASYTLHAIAKNFPSSPCRRKTFRSADFFAQEIQFYTKVWPALDDFQSSKNIQEKFDNIPTLLSAYTGNGDDYVVLEDLGARGFTTVCRDGAFDYDHILMVLKMFAGFHALSIAFRDQEPEKFRATCCVKEIYFAEEFREWYRGLFSSACTVGRDAVEKELPASYLEKFDKVFASPDNLYTEVVKACTFDGPLSAITHGDPWIPNFLFSYDNITGRPSEIAVIDFQLCRYSTLCNDLTFLLFACVDTPLLEARWDDFLNEYLQELGDTLEKLGSNRNLVTRQSIDADLKKSRALGVYIGVECCSVALVDDSEVRDLDMLEGEDAVPLESVLVLKPYKEQEKRRRIAGVIKISADKNLI